MAESWYSSNSCVDTQKLKPWSLNIVGFVLQSLITLIVASKDKSATLAGLGTSMIQSDAEPKCCDKLKDIPKKRWFKMLKVILILWQLSSIIMILIFDIKNIIDKSTLFDNSWDVYKCYACILLTSSNSKTLLSYCMWIYIFSLEHDFRDGPEAVEMNLVKYVFVSCAGGLGYAQLLSLVACIIPSVFIYIWVYGLTIVCSLAVVWCLAGFIADKFSISDRTWFLIFCNILAFAFYLAYVSLGLSVINLFSGIGYWHSFTYVFIEPNWHDYTEHLISNMEAKWQFITTLL